MDSFPEIVVLRVTSKCNNNCKYCYGPKNVKGTNLVKLKKLFGLLASNGTKAILLTGGEPLLRTDFNEIIQALKKLGLRIFLDTNGDLFFKYKETISQNIDVLGLPLDFSNSSYRNKNNFETVLAILNYYKHIKKRPKIRVGTVVTKDNFGELDKIGEILKKYHADIWKIYEFVPQNKNAIENKSSLEIAPTEFRQIANRIKSKFTKSMQVIVSKRKDRNRAYFFIGSDGQVFMPVDDLKICKEKKLGNIFANNIIEKWEKLAVKDNYYKNSEVTFDYKFRV